MTTTRSQSGQALIGTLVIMMLVFAMAGGLALAASSLLHEQVAHRTAITNDLRGEDAITAQVARVAGRSAKDPNPRCQPLATFTNVLPDGFSSQATCLRFDEVAAPDMGSLVLSWSGGCGSAAVPLTQGKHVWLFFAAVNNSSGMVAWADDQGTCDLQLRGKVACSFSHSSPGVGLAAMDCDLDGMGSPTVHVANLLSSPSAVRFVKSSFPNTGDQEGDGSIYELAATTGLGQGMNFEEAAVFVSGDGSLTRLLAGGTL